MSDRKTEILELTAELLKQKSFSAFSYQDLADALGIRKASVHHHFATKADLGLALLEFYGANSRRLMEGLRETAPDPGDALRQFIGGAEAVMLDGAYRVCPHGAFDEDAAVLPESIQEGLAKLRNELWNALTELLEDARQAGGANFGGEASAQALLVMAALEGARAAARCGDREPFKAVVRQLLSSMGLEE